MSVSVVVYRRGRVGSKLLEATPLCSDEKWVVYRMSDEFALIEELKGNVYKVVGEAVWDECFRNSIAGTLFDIALLEQRNE